MSDNSSVQKTNNSPNIFGGGLTDEGSGSANVPLNQECITLVSNSTEEDPKRCIERDGSPYADRLEPIYRARTKVRLSKFDEIFGTKKWPEKKSSGPQKHPVVDPTSNNMLIGESEDHSLLGPQILWADSIDPESRQCNKIIHRRDPPCMDWRGEKCSLRPHSRHSRVDELYGTDQWPEKKDNATPCDPKPCIRPGFDPSSNNMLFKPTFPFVSTLENALAALLDPNEDVLALDVLIPKYVISGDLLDR